MNEKKQSTVKRILGTRGMGAVITAFAGLIIIYVAFGLIDRKVFAGQNVMNLLRSMSKYLLIGVGQSYLLITGNIDLSIGSMVGMSAMISATLMAMGVNPFVAMAVAMACCLVTGVINGMLVGKFKLPPFIATLGTMFVTRALPTWSITTETRMPSPPVSERKQGIKFQERLLLWKDTWCLQHLLDRSRDLSDLLLPALKDPHRKTYLRDRLQRGCCETDVNVVNTTIKAYLVSAVCACVVGLPLRTGRNGQHGSRKHVRDVRRCGRRYRRHLPARRNRTSARNLCWCGCMADTGEWSEHDRCTGRHPETCHRYHRCILCTS